MTKLAIGDRVRLTSTFLRSTGQYTGREPASVWTITGFCNGGRWAVTDQPIDDLSLFSAQELAADPTLRYRRIAVAHLQRVRVRK